MFGGLINHAKAAVSGLVLKYVARASVAVPFVIALGFVLAAITVTLVERFGHATAYWIVAGGLAVIGGVAAIVVSVKEHEEETAEREAARSETQEAVSETAAQAVAQAPLALLSAMFAGPGGVTTVVKLARVLGQNLPLVLLLVMIGALFWPTETDGMTEADLEMPRKPNGSDSLPSELRH